MPEDRRPPAFKLLIGRLYNAGVKGLALQQMVRLDTRNKRRLDSLKLMPRNAFYRTLRPFKTADNNCRDDHELFRNLTQADGVLVGSAELVEGYLLPTVN